MRAFLRRYRERSLTSSDIDRLFKVIIIPLLIPSFLGMVVVDSESAGGGIVVEFAFRIVFVPMSAACILLAFSLPREPLWWQMFRVLIALLSAAVITYASIGYFNLANALTGSSQPILVSGPVTEMKAESGRYAGKLHSITVRYNDREVTLTTTPQEFAQLRVGDIYSREMKLGGLGYYYTWGLAFWK